MFRNNFCEATLFKRCIKRRMDATLISYGTYHITSNVQYIYSMLMGLYISSDLNPP